MSIEGHPSVVRQFSNKDNGVVINSIIHPK